MRLVVDTSVLVGELLRVAGRERLGDPRLELFLPEHMAEELRVELPRRVAAFARHRHLPAQVGEHLATACLAAVEANVAVLERAVYSAVEHEARARMPRDHHDWPVVAGALVLAAGIWTQDHDFLGSGVATWTTATLTGWLARQPS